MVIATKISEPMRPEPNGRGLSRKAVLAEADACLKRLAEIRRHTGPLQSSVLGSSRQKKV